MAADRTADVFAVLFEGPGPQGFTGPAVGRITVADVLAELSVMDAPTSDEVARAAYERRIARRVAGRGGDRP